jgi:NAD(P)-dependent dehydrogenase (short-subunit alcohol dehydrogenase family)
MDPGKMGKSMPLRRIGESEDVAYPILFLASDASRYVTAQAFGVDGEPSMGGLPDED